MGTTFARRLERVLSEQIIKYDPAKVRGLMLQALNGQRYADALRLADKLSELIKSYGSDDSGIPGVSRYDALRDCIFVRMAAQRGLAAAQPRQAVA